MDAHRHWYTQLSEVSMSNAQPEFLDPRSQPDAESLRATLQHERTSLRQYEGVVSVGIGWREEKLSLVVQAEDEDAAERLRMLIGGRRAQFPTVVEHVPLRQAASNARRS
jgi:hypothetical protein